MESSGCCEVITTAAQTMIGGAIADIPQLNATCPQLGEVFTDICVAEDGEEGGDGKEQGEEKDDDGDTTGAGNTTIMT